MRLQRTLPLALATLIACGPKGPSTPVMVHLPGDQDTHDDKPLPKVTPPAPTDPWAGRTDLIQAPAAQPPAAIKLPPVSHFTLKNGLDVFVVQSSHLPVVSMQLAIKAGRNAEPKGKVGVSDFAADMLVKGTKKHTALKLAQQIDDVGGQLTAQSSFEATLVDCSVLSRDLSTCMNILPEIVSTSTFPKDEMEKVRNQLHGEISQRLDDAGQLASLHFQNLLWGNDHVRGWVTSDQSIDAISRDDLMTWQKTWFSPSNSILAVAGDVDPKTLQKQLETAFGGWKKTKTPALPTYAEPKLDRVEIRLVDKPKQTQTHIRVGQVGITHTDPRFFASLVWNYVLGGGEFSSRLMKVVRAAGGKTYGASSTFDRNLDKGSFVVATFTRTAETVSTLKLVLGEIKKMHDEGPTDAEVQDAISNISGSYGLRYESASDVASALLAAELHGLGQDYLEQYAVNVGKVDTAAAKKAAGEILDTSRYVIVLVGDAKEIAPQLDQEGWKYEVVRYTDPIGTVPAPEAPKVSPADLKAAKKLLADALTAKGKKAATMKSLVMTAKGSLSSQQGKLDVTIQRAFLLPDKMRVDLIVDVPQMGKQTISYAVDGSKGWQAAPDGSVNDIPDEDVVTLLEQRWHDPELILIHATEKGTVVQPLPDDTVDGKSVSVIHLIAADGAGEATIYIDKKSKQIVQMAYPESGHITVDSFSDFKDDGGVQIAHARKSESGGESAELTVDKVEIDGTVDAKLFAKPTK